MSLPEEARKGVRNNRYFQVGNCFSPGVFVYDYATDKPSEARDIYLPDPVKVEFNEHFSSLVEYDSPPGTAIMAVVKRDRTKYRPGRINPYDEGKSRFEDVIDMESDAYPENGITLRFTVKVG